MNRLILFGLALLLSTSGDAQTQKTLAKLPYNHAERLVVDLQVGLWAQPLPMDFDGDGDLDIAVTSFYDNPIDPADGFVYLENTGGLKFRELKIGEAIRTVLT